MITDHHPIKKHPWIIVAVILLLGIGIKTLLLATDRLPFNADEAVVGLMAAHILDGELPVFFWGQSYMGSLDALFVAGAFLLLGKSVLAIRCVQILLFCGTIVTTYQLGYRIIGKVEAGWIAALLMAVPTVNVTLYSTISLGGYGEALFIGNLILLACLQVMDKNTWHGWLLLGFLTGLGVWVNGITLVYSIPAVCICFFYLIKKKWRMSAPMLLGRLGLLTFAFIVGALPWWIYGFQYGFTSLISELSGSVIAYPEVGFFQGLGNRIVSFLLFGLTVIFGFRPSWEIRWLLLPLLPLVFIIWVIILTGFLKQMKTIPGLLARGILLWLIILCLITGFILTPFGNDPSGRYFLPVSVVLSIMTGAFLSLPPRFGNWRLSILGLLILYNLGGTAQCWLKYPPGFTTQFDSSTIYDHRDRHDLISFLQDNSLKRGYTTYWIAYPLAFLSEEQLIFIPRLPYHRDYRYTERDDRYPLYRQMVSASDDVAYITARQDWLDDYLRDQFALLGVEWRESKIGDFTIFYRLSRLVHPQEIGLGVTTGNQ